MKNYIENLRSITEQVKQAEYYLRVSYERCKNIGLKGPHSEDDLIEFEALTGRFARTVDIIIHKLFRGIDVVEVIDGGTLIDTMNRAEKRGLIPDAAKLRALKDLRNDIAHEYVADKLTQLHEEVYGEVPILFDIVGKSLLYAQRYL